MSTPSLYAEPADPGSRCQDNSVELVACEELPGSQPELTAAAARSLKSYTLKGAQVPFKSPFTGGMHVAVRGLGWLYRGIGCP